MDRRAFLATLAAGAAVSVTARTAPHTRTVRLRWPWPVKLPDPHASNDLVAALLGVVLFPPLYVRAIDGMLEPRLAVGSPKEVGKGSQKGLRVDLAPSVRPSDVVASIANARTGAAKLALRELPVPRVDGAHGVVFLGLADVDALMRRLATPLAGIARFEPRRVLPSAPYDLSVEARPTGETRLTVTRRPSSPSVGMAVSPTARIGRFELDGAVDLGRSLRAFERYESEVAWLTDGLFAPRPGARAIDLGALGYLAIRAGTEAPELMRPGMVLGIVDAIAPDRIAHLGLIRRGVTAPPESAPPRDSESAPPHGSESALPRGSESAPPRDPASLAPNTPILVRSSMPIALAAAEILARDLGGIARALDDATFDRALSEGRYPLLVDVVRPLDDSPDGAAVALATFDRSSVAPAPGTSARAVAEAGSAALGWEIALIGAEAAHVWIPRAPLGGFDLEIGSAG